jgi:hypothetical protein
MLLEQNAAERLDTPPTSRHQEENASKRRELLMNRKDKQNDYSLA